MSYSLDLPCGGCKKIPSCADHSIIRGAVEIIHSLSEDSGHKGGGDIKMSCFNKDIDTPVPTDED